MDWQAQDSFSGVNLPIFGLFSGHISGSITNSCISLAKEKAGSTKNYYKIKSIVYLYFIKKQMIFDENFNNSL